MLRRSLLVAAFVLVATQTGCRSRCNDRCGERHGFFNSLGRSEAPCQTVGRNGGCFDAATGQPVPCPPTGGIPGGIPGPGPIVPGGPGGIEVGPMPNPTNPNDMIPRQGVPFAPPSPAPSGSDTMLPLPTFPGTPVRGGPNK